MFDCSEPSSEQLLSCLDEIRFSIPEFFLLNFICKYGACLLKNDLIKISRQFRQSLFHRPSEKMLESAIDSLLKRGCIIEINDYHLDTINRLMDMCKIENRGLAPENGCLDATPRGFSIFLHWTESVFNGTYIQEYDSVGLTDENLIFHGFATSPELLIHAIENSTSPIRCVPIAKDDIEYCGQWCRRWWKILPVGYSFTHSEIDVNIPQNQTCSSTVVQPISSDSKPPNP